MDLSTPKEHDDEEKQDHDGPGVDDDLHGRQEVGVLLEEGDRHTKQAIIRLSAECTGFFIAMTPIAPARIKRVAVAKTRTSGMAYAVASINSSPSYGDEDGVLPGSSSVLADRAGRGGRRQAQVA